MKGVSAVIAVILLLMITVALAATSYVWFSSIFSTVTTGGTAATEQSVATIQASYMIESAYYNATGYPASKIQVVIRNTGSSSINMTTAATYIGDTPQTSETPTANMLASNGVATINVTNSTPACGAVLKVSFSVGSAQTRTITGRGC